MTELKDVQKERPKNKIDIDEVGIKNIHVPFRIIHKSKNYQKITGKVNLLISLSAEHKGTHMSRFVEILNNYSNKILHVKVLDKLVKEVLKKLDCEKAKIEIEFDYFKEKEAPISKIKSIMNYNCKIIRVAKKNLKEPEHILQIKVPITTLCPCSKEISKYGAHNQRGYVTIHLKFNEFIWIEDLIKIVEDQSSCEIYPLLKRPDEKFVTEKAYENPKFVEDVVRDVAFELQKDKRIEWFKVECENEESIHLHNVYSSITKQ